MRFNKSVWLLVICGAQTALIEAAPVVTPYLSFRSQGEDDARHMVGVVNHVYDFTEADEKDLVVHQPVNVELKIQKTEKQTSWYSRSKHFLVSHFWKGDAPVHKPKHQPVVKKEVKSEGPHNYGFFSVTPEYMRSFDSKALAKDLFSCSYLQEDMTTVRITGTSVADRGEKDLLANYFDLAPDYEGSICFKPRVQNVVVDVDLFWGMDKWAHGLFLRLYAPITWTQWDLGAQFQTTNPGTLVEGGYTYLNAPEKFFCKKQAFDVTGVTTHPLTSARFCDNLCDCDDLVAVRLADVRADLGWNFLRRDNGRLGFFARGVAPTGNRPNGRWLFEPIVGNGRHWEVGGGLTGSVVFWHGCHEDNYASLSVFAAATHMFDALQYRVFDLKCKPLSRYMPAYKNDPSEISPVANLTATAIKSSFAVQGEAVAMFNCTLGNWTGDLGYNFWATTRENIECSDKLSKCYGEGIIKNAGAFGNTDEWLFDFDADIHQEPVPVVRRVITNADIDYDSARTRGMSHKIFAHTGYSWMACRHVPFLGLGGFAEFGANNTGCSSDGSTVSLSQWGVWVKGGVAF